MGWGESAEKIGNIRDVDKWGDGLEWNGNMGKAGILRRLLFENNL